MRGKAATVFFLIILSLALASCKTMYRANSVHTPMFKEKGEVQSSVLTGSGGSELQLAYAVTDNFAIMANGVFDKSKARVIDTLYNVKSGNSNYQNLYLEGGIGYYKTVNYIITL